MQIYTHLPQKLSTQQPLSGSNFEIPSELNCQKKTSFSEVLESKISLQTRQRLRHLIIEKMQQSACGVKQLTDDHCRDIVSDWQCYANYSELWALSSVKLVGTNSNRVVLYSDLSAKDKVTFFYNFFYRYDLPPLSNHRGFNLDGLNQSDKDIVTNWLVTGSVKKIDINIIVTFCMKNKLSKALAWFFEKQQLTELHLSGRLDGEAVEVLTTVLKENNTLKKLVLKNGLLGTAEMKCLGEVLKTNTALKFLDLTGNEITSDGVRELCVGLKQNIGLEGLILSANNIEVPAANCLGEMLETNHTLKSINLNNNEIGSGIQVLCGALQKNTTLENLALFDMQIDLTSAKFLETLFKTNSSLRSLEVSPTSVESMQIILSGIKESKTLRELKLINYYLSHEPGLTYLCEMIKTNKTLVSLTMVSGNATIIRNICSALAGNKTMKLINFEGTNIFDFSRQYILDAVKSHLSSGLLIKFQTADKFTNDAQTLLIQGKERETMLEIYCCVSDINSSYYLPGEVVKDVLAPYLAFS